MIIVYSPSSRSHNLPDTHHPFSSFLDCLPSLLLSAAVSLLLLLHTQAASIYLWMVALGSLLYLIIVSYSPSSRPANVDKCTLLIICSWLGPSAHLLLLRLLPRAAYVRHRTHIILAMRTFYIAATSVNGFGLCGVGPLQEKKHAVAVAFQSHNPWHSAASSALDAAAAAAATFASADPFASGVYPEALGGGGVSDNLNSTLSIASSVASSIGSSMGGSVLGSSSSSSSGGARCPAESPFSAMLWRSGIIGLIWWGCAFPLPFSTHVPMQVWWWMHFSPSPPLPSPLR
jgi:hypothetical protein